MNVEINGKSLELSFGFKFLREIDNRLGLKVEQASIGQGVSMLPVGLESGNPVVIGEVLIAATSHLKQAITINNIDEALDEIAENIGLEEFGSDILTELGKRPMTRNLVEVVETEENQRKPNNLRQNRYNLYVNTWYYRFERY